MDKREFQDKIKELYKKTVTSIGSEDIIVYDADRKGLIYIDDEGYFYLSDEYYNYRKTHFNLKDIVNMKYQVYFSDEDKEEYYYDTIDESYIFIYFNSKENIVIIDNHDYSSKTLYFYVKAENESKENIEFFKDIRNKKINDYNIEITLDTDKDKHFYG